MVDNPVILAKGQQNEGNGSKHWLDDDKLQCSLLASVGVSVSAQPYCEGGGSHVTFSGTCHPVACEEGDTAAMDVPMVAA